MLTESANIHLLNLNKDGRFTKKDSDKLFSVVEGYLVDVSIKEHPDKDGLLHEYLRIVLKWQNEVYIFSTHFKYSVANRILNILPNIDITNLLTIKAYKDNNGYPNVFLEQNGLMVPYYYSKEDPKDKPLWIKKRDGSFDNTFELHFFRGKVQEINQALKKFIQPVTSADAPLHNPHQSDMTIADDGLPF